MRYFVIDWKENKPSESEIFSHIRKMIGEQGVAESKFFMRDGLICASNKWAEKIRGALALKWQFEVKTISGTKKKAKKLKV